MVSGAEVGGMDLGIRLPEAGCEARPVRGAETLRLRQAVT